MKSLLGLLSGRRSPPGAPASPTSSSSPPLTTTTTTTGATGSFDPLAGNTTAKNTAATTTNRKKEPTAAADAATTASNKKKKKKTGMTGSDDAPEKKGAADGTSAKAGADQAKKGAAGYHYWHAQANQGTAPKAQPVKLTDEEASKLAKDMEGKAGAGLSSWNKVSEHPAPPRGSVLFFIFLFLK